MRCRPHSEGCDPSIVNGKKNTFNNPVHRGLFSNDFISLRVQCGLKLLGWFTHRKFTCMFASCAVFIRFMMVTRGEDIRMSSEYLRPNQASLKKIILILLLLLSTCAIWIIGISIVNRDFYHNYSLFEQICQDTLVKNDKNARKKTEKAVMANIAILLVLILFCSYNKFRVNRYIGSHGRSCISQRRQNIMTFRQLVSATYIFILNNVVDDILLLLLRYPFTSHISQQDYRHILQIYFILETVALTVLLPLSWLKSVWKNLPEFSTKEVTYIQKPPEVASDIVNIQDILKPRGPYSYENYLSAFPKSPKSNNHHTPASFVYIRKPKNDSIKFTNVSCPSELVYLSKSSDNTPLVSLKSTLYYTSTFKKTLTSECPQQTNIKVIRVQGLPAPELEDDCSDS